MYGRFNILLALILALWLEQQVVSAAKLKTRVATIEKLIEQIDEQINCNINARLEAFAKVLDGIKAEVREKCQTGEVGFYEDLVCSRGKRCEHSATIQFDPPFGVPPVVMEAFSTLDSARDKNLRVVSEVSDITTETAKLRVFTWDDSDLYGAKLSWIACPKLE